MYSQCLYCVLHQLMAERLERLCLECHFFQTHFPYIMKSHHSFVAWRHVASLWRLPYLLPFLSFENAEISLTWGVGGAAYNRKYQFCVGSSLLNVCVEFFDNQQLFTGAVHGPAKKGPAPDMPYPQTTVKQEPSIFHLSYFQCNSSLFVTYEIYVMDPLTPQQ